MRTAVLLTGNLRTWMQCKDTFHRTYDPHNVDVFVVTYNTLWGYHPHNQGVMNDSTEDTISDADIREAFSSVNLINMVITNFRQGEGLWQCHPSFKHLHSNVFAPIDNVVEGLDLIADYEEANNFKYDTIIKTRTDILYHENASDLLHHGPSDVIIDSRNSYPNDWIFITSRDNMFNMYEFVLDEVENPVYTDSHQVPPHRLYENAMRHNKLNIHSRELAECLLRKNNFKQYY